MSVSPKTYLLAKLFTLTSYYLKSLLIERWTGLEPATFSLEDWRSTNWVTIAFVNHNFRYVRVGLKPLSHLFSKGSLSLNYTKSLCFSQPFLVDFLKTTIFSWLLWTDYELNIDLRIFSPTSAPLTPSVQILRREKSTLLAFYPVCYYRKLWSVAPPPSKTIPLVVTLPPLTCFYYSISSHLLGSHYVNTLKPRVSSFISRDDTIRTCARFQKHALVPKTSEVDLTPPHPENNHSSHIANWVFVYYTWTV